MHEAPNHAIGQVVILFGFISQQMRGGIIKAYERQRFFF